MSKLSQLRKKVRYETSVPRCATCMHYKKPYVYLTTNSMTKRSKPQCSLHVFSIENNACCDIWTGIDGTVLSDSAESEGEKG